MSEYAGLQQHVYHADLKYSQKILGLINDNTNIFYKDAHSRSGIEFSHFGGGNYQIYNDADPSETAKFNFTNSILTFNLEFNLKPRFNFIPTTSGLDIGNYIQTLGSNNLRASYVGANPPIGIYSSPFANFSTDFNPITDDYHNYRHITFNPRNGEWLASELNAARNPNNTPTTTDCSLFCGLSEITGSEFICDGANYTYSIPELSGADINWSVSGLQILSGQGTSNVVVKDNGGFNTKSIAVTISSITCGTITLNKSIYSGVPTMFGNISGWNIIQTYSNQKFSLPLTYTAPNTTGATYYEWDFDPIDFDPVPYLGVPTSIPTNWEILESTSDTKSISVRSDLNTNGQIKVRACNECGCTAYTTLNVTHQHNNHPGWELAPNPTTGDILNIMRVDGAPTLEFPGNRTDVFIYNLQSQKVHEFEITSEGGSTNVAHLAEGVYKVQIDMQNGNFEVLNLSISR